MKKFNFTFTQKDKYSSVTRTISISANNEINARGVFLSEYGKYATIQKIEEIKEEKKEN